MDEGTEAVSIQAQCEKLAEIDGALRVAAYFFDPEAPKEITGIRLMFEQGDWTVSVDPDDDSVLLYETTDTDFTKWKVADASTYFPWAAAVGKNIRWVWTLENQNGYVDGLQFELFDRARGGVVSIQVVGVNSRLDVRAVLPVETPFLRAP
ncbi:DUF6334 family protein [Longispora sp. K20-0274]|uniref:DUF6334 family protein n=1 Tax=Longispora sp. K20-0274 TaxID=3088255 RepID=UPI003999D214